jgi:hypothetical protein
MKTRIVLMALLALAGCGRSEQPEDGGSAKSTAKAQPVAADAVAAVLQSGAPIARLSFMLDMKPQQGSPATMRLDFSAPEAMALSMVAESDGLTLDPATAKGSVTLTGGGAVTSHELRFTAQREGLIEIVVRLRKDEADGAETVYAIPVLAAPAAAGG